MWVNLDNNALIDRSITSPITSVENGGITPALGFADIGKNVLSTNGLE